ncbi:MAG: hypothetical protein IPG45_21725 [Deltaproteobacteria bacterium]|jgi:hypothetical protein|nr:hypothetical protein [Deltaproteobacteria bacterium]
MPIENDGRIGGGYSRPVHQPLETDATGVVSRTHRRPPNVGRSGFERVSGGHESTEVSGGTKASKSGFDLIGGYQRLTQRGKQAAIASAVGFLLLLPPGVGQLMHPGVPKASSSPVAMLMAEKSELPTGARIRAEVDRFQSEVPWGGTGPARKLAIREMIDHHDRVTQLDGRISGIASDAASLIEALKAEVGLDAKLGYGADWYWFGVPPQHATYHAGVSDNQGIQSHAQGVRQALGYAREVTRNEVSKLLIDESPAYKQLHAKYTHEKNRLEAATGIRALADEASDALSTASHAITMRNLTPKTVEEPVYEDRTRSDGTSERVQTGTRTVDNPAWDSWNLIAIAAKSRAEGRIRELNRATQAHSQLLGIGAQGVAADLIGVWDFFRQPSFGIWSFDSFDVDAAKSKTDGLRGAMDVLIVQIRRVHDPLKAEVNAAIDARWKDLAGGNPTDNDERDPLARLRNTTRRRDEDGPDWEPEGPPTR